MPQIMEKINSSILFIGTGSMAESIIKGLIYSRVIPSEHIYIINKNNKQRLQELKHDYEVVPVESLAEGLSKAQIIILAVKPDSIKSVCNEIKPLISKQHIIISVAAGVKTTTIEHILGNKPEVIRTMPNTSSSICESATGICAGKYAGQMAIDIAKRIFDTVGEVVIVKESQIDIVTGLSGSGPAYIYYLIEGLEKAGINAGLSEENVRKLVTQTVYGAAKMIIELHTEPTLLRKQVTSPKGTTEAGIKVLEHYDLHGILNKTVEKAIQRASEIGKELEKDI